MQGETFTDVIMSLRIECLGSKQPYTNEYLKESKEKCEGGLFKLLVIRQASIDIIKCYLL